MWPSTAAAATVALDVCPGRAAPVSAVMAAAVARLATLLLFDRPYWDTSVFVVFLTIKPLFLFFFVFFNTVV